MARASSDNLIIFIGENNISNQTIKLIGIGIKKLLVENISVFSIIWGDIKIKIKRLRIKNFKGYKYIENLCFNDLTTLIGENDSGKITITEFFS